MDGEIYHLFVFQTLIQINSISHLITLTLGQTCATWAKNVSKWEILLIRYTFGMHRGNCRNYISRYSMPGLGAVVKFMTKISLTIQGSYLFDVAFLACFGANFVTKISLTLSNKYSHRMISLIPSARFFEHPRPQFHIYLFSRFDISRFKYNT